MFYILQKKYNINIYKWDECMERHSGLYYYLYNINTNFAISILSLQCIDTIFFNISTIFAISISQGQQHKLGERCLL